MEIAEQTSQVSAGGPTLLPVLPLRDVVVYPHMVIPLFVGRQKSIAALEQAIKGDKQIVLIAQKSAEIDDPTADDLYRVGAMANILQLLKLPDGTMKVLVEGTARIRVDSLLETEELLSASVSAVEEDAGTEERELEGLSRSVLSLFDQYVKLHRKIPVEILTSLAGIDDPSRLADTIAAHLAIKLEEKQAVLEMLSLRERIEHLIGLIEIEVDLLNVEKRVRGRVKQQMEKNQREYYLNEQIKAIQKELGELGGEGASEVDELDRRIKEVGLSKEARDKAEGELNKLRQMSPMAAEATVIRNYLDWLLGLPWKKRSKVKHDLKLAQKVLDEEHYGLGKVKERILEYLAVQQRVKSVKGPILCLVGPPGVGKTSLGQSIARATNRKFTRFALGGVRDEAEIRGHRRTYIGSMPGKIIQSLSKVGTRNPLFLLDEIDKMAMDFRGDPAAALLEVLDPEQNHTFNDHYLEVDFDLSDVMFIATANTLNIPPPLLDRMEVIRLPGYTEDEKTAIARRYLIPKQMKQNGVRAGELAITEPAVRDMVRHYTREAGVRNLEREIAKVCRKSVKEALLREGKGVAERAGKRVIGPQQLEKYLGVRRFRYDRADEQDRVGQVTGLAWTEVGGDLLTIEAAVVPGKGKLTFTGKLGEVMQESIKAAMTVVRSRATLLGINPEFHEKSDLHIHVPEGAIPKDGPSAGIAMCTALVSTLTGIPVRANVAMTGEITLRGEVLPIGGLKEKLLAAHRGGITQVLIPEENRKDLAEVPKNILGKLEVVPVRWIDQVLDLALARSPVPAVSDEEVVTAAGDPARTAESPAAGRAH